VQRIANPDHRLMLFATAGLLTAVPAALYLLS